MCKEEVRDSFVTVVVAKKQLLLLQLWLTLLNSTCASSIQLLFVWDTFPECGVVLTICYNQFNISTTYTRQLKLFMCNRILSFINEEVRDSFVTVVVAKKPLLLLQLWLTLLNSTFIMHGCYLRGISRLYTLSVQFLKTILWGLLTLASWSTYFIF